MPCRAVVCRDFETQVADGRLVAGHNDTYHANQPLAYGCDPAENVVFIGCHDNDTMFDQVCGAIERIMVCIACMWVGGGAVRQLVVRTLGDREEPSLGEREENVVFIGCHITTQCFTRFMVP